jgi:hypothetical protein
LNKSQKRNSFAVVTIIVFCLLFYAIGVLLRLIDSFVFAPDVEAIVVEVVAGILFALMFSFDFIEKRKGMPLDSPDSYLLSIGAQESGNSKVVPDFDVSQSIKVQKSTILVEAASVEPKNYSVPVKELIERAVRICPACRKELNSLTLSNVVLTVVFL